MNGLRYLVTAFVVVCMIAFFNLTSIAAGNAAARDVTEDATYAKPGFHTLIEDGRLWVFRQAAKEFEDFRREGELAKQIIRPGAGPGGITLKAPDSETITLYLASKPGFYLAMEGERLWVFREGAKELDDFRRQGELAKHVIRPGAGPGGITLKAPDSGTLDDYLATR